MSKLSVIIPAYNEFGNLKVMIPILVNTLKKEKINSEIIIIDDGSKDKTWLLINELKKKYKNIVALSNRRNLGLTETLNKGFSHAKGDIILFLPADFESHPNEDVPILMNRLNQGYDMVIGRRINRKGTKKISSSIYNFLIRTLFKVNLHDANWIKVFRRDILKSFRLRSDWHRYLPIFATMEGYKVSEAKVKYYPRKYGKSKYGLKRLLIGSIDLIVIKFLFTFKKKPMLLFGTAGLFSLILGIIGGIYIYYLHIVSSISNRPLVYLVMLLIILGIQFFAIGFIGELLVDLMEKEK